MRGNRRSLSQETSANRSEMLTPELKYIMVRDEHTKGEYPILFPKDLIHRQVGRIHHVGDTVVVSAGFCQLSDFGVSAYGESESLNKTSRPQDASIIKEFFIKEVVEAK